MRAFERDRFFPDGFSGEGSSTRNNQNTSCSSPRSPGKHKKPSVIKMVNQFEEISNKSKLNTGSESDGEYSQRKRLEALMKIKQISTKTSNIINDESIRLQETRREPENDNQTKKLISYSNLDEAVNKSALKTVDRYEVPNNTNEDNTNYSSQEDYLSHVQVNFTSKFEE